MSPLVLAYHGVAQVPFEADRHRLFVSPRQVARDLELLRRWGYQITTFSEVARRVAEAGPGGTGRVAALTFDDGLADNATELLPLLRAHRATATVFVVSGWLGARHPDAPAPFDRVLRADQVRQLHSHGIEIGAHGRRHLHLVETPDAELATELRGSRDDLEALLEAPVRALAYPYGEADDRVRTAAGAAGFTSACRTSGEGSWASPLDLPRQSMGNGASIVGLRLKRIDRYELAMRPRPMRWARRVSRRAHNHLDARRAATDPSSPPPPRR